MRRSPLLVLGSACALVALSACEMPRPQKSYLPQDEAEGDAAVNPGKQLGDHELPDLGDPNGNGNHGSGGDGNADGNTADAGPMGGDGTTQPDSIESKLAGEYWMRLDFYTRATSQAGTIATHTTSFAQAQVGIDQDGKLKMIDWQCVVTNDQRCESGCGTARTDIAEVAGKAYRPAIRTVTVDEKAGTWSTNMVPFALGWEGDFNKNPNAVMPSAPNDTGVLSPDGGKPGIDVKVTVTDVDAALGGDAKCTLGVVQKLAYSYSGKLAGDAFGKGTVVQDMATTQNVLASDCNTDSVKSYPMATYTIQLVHAPRAIDTEHDWACPTKTEFQGALPNP